MSMELIPSAFCLDYLVTMDENDRKRLCNRASAMLRMQSDPCQDEKYEAISAKLRAGEAEFQGIKTKTNTHKHEPIQLSIEHLRILAQRVNGFAALAGRKFRQTSSDPLPTGWDVELGHGKLSLYREFGCQSSGGTMVHGLQAMIDNAFPEALEAYKTDKPVDVAGWISKGGRAGGIHILGRIEAALVFLGIEYGTLAQIQGFGRPYSPLQTGPNFAMEDAPTKKDETPKMDETAHKEKKTDFNSLPPEIQYMIFERVGGPPECAHFYASLFPTQKDWEVTRGRNAAYRVACRRSNKALIFMHDRGLWGATRRSLLFMYDAYEKWDDRMAAAVEKPWIVGSPPKPTTPWSQMPIREAFEREREDLRARHVNTVLGGPSGAVNVTDMNAVDVRCVHCPRVTLEEMDVVSGPGPAPPGVDPLIDPALNRSLVAFCCQHEGQYASLGIVGNGYGGDSLHVAVRTIGMRLLQAAVDTSGEEWSRFHRDEHRFVVHRIHHQEATWRRMAGINRRMHVMAGAMQDALHDQAMGKPFGDCNGMSEQLVDYADCISKDFREI